ncbi:Mysoin-binding motif of peroxisomes-domain-containing protein [Morchella snyderi]|nr:Mysoin-binding motif of peroxisomes-domain-containing protein [Morchella snyderi]
MESIVYANSPLAEYLEGNGENAADWEIEPQLSDLADDYNEHHHFAPPLSARITTRGLKLGMGESGWARKAKFYELFSKAVDSRLSRSENARFLERFRYVIVASQLLNEHVNVSHYDRKSGEVAPSLDEDASSHIFASQYAKSRYWAGSGGFVLAISLLLAWVLRGGNGSRGIGKGRAIAALMLSMMVAIFLFAHARRTWLRSLRSKAIEFATVFVQNSQSFDVLASNAVTLIQEVELVSRGYRLSTPLPPITRLERDSQTRRCARLRHSILSALTLGIPPHIGACKTLRNLTQEVDLEKYYDIYDIQREDVGNMDVGINKDDFEDMESLKALKSLLHRLHTIRRILLCCFLAIDADGAHPDYNKWRVAVEQLQALGNLMGELGADLKRILSEEQEFIIPPTPKLTTNTVENERYRGQLRKLNSLSQALRGLQAKMHVLREESDRNSRDSQDFSDFAPELIAHYDSIGSDLHALVSEWEDGRSFLAMNLDRNSPQTKSPESLSGATLVGETPRNSMTFSKDTDALGLGLYTLQSASTEEENDVEEVYEAVSAPRPRSMMTREERILKVAEERTRALEQKKRVEAGLALQKELQSVLVKRPPARKIIMSRNLSA